MKTTFTIIAIALSASCAQAQQGTTTISPYLGPATNPSVPAGSVANPYVVQGPQGQQLGTVTSTIPSSPAQPAGTTTNPWVYQPSPGR